MKVFNGKKAAEDYMSAHTLAFSTPELTLTRFAFWLGDIIPDPADKDSTMPRLYSYVDEKDFAPANIIDDETYVPTGAVKQSSAYGSSRSTTESEYNLGMVESLSAGSGIMSPSQKANLVRVSSGVENASV